MVTNATGAYEFARFLFLLLFLGIFAPDRLASLSAMATACLRFFTFLPLPDFNSPCLYSCMTFLVLARPLDFEDLVFLEAVRLLEEVFLAMVPDG